MRDTYRLDNIKPEEIAFSKANPRNEPEAEILADESFEQLKDSVAHYGVLVPVVVHPNPRNQKKPYVLVDGERRLRAALATGRPTIPAHITQGKKGFDQLIQALHIHMLRKQWKPIAQVRAFKRIYSDFKHNNRGGDILQTLQEIQTRTGCTDKQIKEFYRVIQYPEDVLHDVETDSIKYSYLVTFEENFIDPVKKEFPEVFDQYTAKEIRKKLVNKVRMGTLDKTRTFISDFRPLLIRAETVQERAFLKILIVSFLEKSEMSVSDMAQQYEAKFPPSEEAIELADKIIANLENLNEMLKVLNTTEIQAYPKRRNDLVSALEQLKKAIANKLRYLKRKK